MPLCDCAKYSSLGILVLQRISPGKTVPYWLAHQCRVGCLESMACVICTKYNVHFYTIVIFIWQIFPGTKDLVRSTEVQVSQHSNVLHVANPTSVKGHWSDTSISNVAGIVSLHVHTVRIKQNVKTSWIVTFGFGMKTFFCVDFKSPWHSMLVNPTQEGSTFFISLFWAPFTFDIVSTVIQKSQLFAFNVSN